VLCALMLKVYLIGFLYRFLRQLSLISLLVQKCYFFVGGGKFKVLFAVVLSF
jgi:hypothetical protein